MFHATGREAPPASEPAEMQLTNLALAATLAAALLAGCSNSSDTTAGTPGNVSVPGVANPIPTLSASGLVETRNNLRNETVVARDPNVFKAEYDAGFVQGQQQSRLLPGARDNMWDVAYLTDPTHSFPEQEGPSAEERALARFYLLENYNYTVHYLRTTQDADLRVKLSRVLFRLLGIYHGATRSTPAALDFSEKGVPDLSNFSQQELTLTYESPTLTFADLYWINGFSDVMDVIAYDGTPVGGLPEGQIDKCSAFVKRTADDIYITHNSWYGFLDQSMAFNLQVNDTFMTFNALGPGLLASSTDFGYNNKGIMFNETTHLNSTNQPRADRLWMYLRAALAEQFAGSVDEFYHYLSLEASGTYCNGYMVVDVKNRDIGLVEMSYKNFVFFKSDARGGGISVTTKPEGIDKTFDPELMQRDIILGINMPASIQIRTDLSSVDNRPARRPQFLAGIPSVNDVESSKSLITFTDPTNPLSIYGRWDLGYGLTPKPKTIPDGSCDAKAISATLAAQALNLQGILDPNSGRRSFWMKYGSPYVNGQPFIWSQSQWKGQKLRDVPDRVDGDFQFLTLPIR